MSKDRLPYIIRFWLFPHLSCLHIFPATLSKPLIDRIDNRLLPFCQLYRVHSYKKRRKYSIYPQGGKCFSQYKLSQKKFVLKCYLDSLEDELIVRKTFPFPSLLALLTD